MTLEFTAIRNPDGIRIRDPIENVQFEVYPGTRAFDRAPADDFVFPVDDVVAFRTDALTVPRLLNLYVRTPDGDLVAECSNQNDLSVDDGAYYVECSFGKLKFYVAVEGAVSVDRRDYRTVLDFESERRVRLGVRSLHKTPAATITIRPRVEDVMRAVSLFGSALKTRSAERSFPNLRGHPPLVEVGDEFAAPDELARTSSPATLELPAACEYVFPASSLAYYLDAAVVEADAPALVYGDYRYEFATGDGFERDVARTLQKVFFLDCVVRTEGLYPVDLHEREAFAADYDLDAAGLYDAPFADQLDAYLDVPFAAVEPHLPAWKVTTDVEPRVENADVLPFTASELSVVRCPGGTTEPAVEPEPESVTNFFRGDGGHVRTTASDAAAGTPDIVHPAPVDSLEHAWVGDGFPLGASKVTVDSYRRRLEHVADDRSGISVDIVCNDPDMADEDVVREYYGFREFFEFDVDVHYDLSCAEFGALLERGTDFLHYVGHVDEHGVQCADGMFDVHAQDAVNVEAFLLNACRSYEQGAALVDRGSLGGIVTLEKVINEPAVRMGRTLARALNAGFSLQSGLAVARNVSSFGNHYITIGDGNLQLVNSETGTSFLARVAAREDADGDGDGDARIRLEVSTYPTTVLGMGSMVTPHVAENTTRYLNSGRIDEFEVSPAELDEFFDLAPIPVIAGDDLYWSDEVTAAELF